jgi:hypothetical protein
MGAITKTIRPRRTTSKTIIYMMHRILKVSHQMWGEDSLHVLTDVYWRMWAVKNQMRVITEENKVSLSGATQCRENKVGRARTERTILCEEVEVHFDFHSSLTGPFGWKICWMRCIAKAFELRLESHLSDHS